jgi:NodT family efflux transporter outer membrane factor (OMF) lipoprotein
VVALPAQIRCARRRRWNRLKENLMNMQTSRSVIATLLSLALTACAVGPDYQRPAVDTPAAFKEAGDWKSAEPRDEAPRGKWWETFGDAQLNALVEQVALNNQNVAAAAAQYRQALALLDATRAAEFPTLSANLSDTRGRGITTASGNPVLNSTKLSFNANWEADVWGRIGRSVEANEAAAAAAGADLLAAQLSAQATLAQSYLQLRIVDAQSRLLEQTLAAYRRSLQITRDRYAAGVAARSDVVQAESQLNATQAQAIDLGVQRAQLEHAVAILTGKPPAELNLAPLPLLSVPALPIIPAAIPSQLLERRPDIAAAERRAAAANAQIGVAQAAFYPDLTLGAAAGYQGQSLSHLLSVPNRFWSLGPAAALTLFDDGARTAAKEQAGAAYDMRVANYRQTVLGAFQEVEDNLAALRILKEEAAVQKTAVASANELLVLTDNQYRAGTVAYLNVITAQAAALAAQIGDLNITGRRLQASVTLLKALGGDWTIQTDKPQAH